MRRYRLHTLGKRLAQQGWRWGGLTALVLIAACSAGPDSGDVRAALERHFAEAMAPAQKHFGAQAGSDLVPKVHEVVLHQCDARSDGQYLCNAQVTLHSKVLGKRSATTRLLMTRDDKGWQVLSQL